MSRVASWLAESTTMISNGGSWTTKLSSNAAMFLASLRTVVTTLTSNAARNRGAVMMVSTCAARGTILISALDYSRVSSYGPHRHDHRDPPGNHQDGPGREGLGRPRPRTCPRTFRSTLRPHYGPDLLPGHAAPGAGRAVRAEGATAAPAGRDDDAAGRRRHEGRGPRHRPRGHEHDRRGGSPREEAGTAVVPRRSRDPVLRQDDARGAESDRRGPALGRPLRADEHVAEEPRTGERDGGRPRRREQRDRRAHPEPRIRREEVPRARPAGPDPSWVHAPHIPPGGERGRQGTAGAGPEGVRGGRGRNGTADRLPDPPADREATAGIRAREAGRRAAVPATHRPDGLPGHADPREGSGDRDDGLRWTPGGKLLLPRAVRHLAREHGASGDLGDRIERPRGDGPRAGPSRGPPPARRETGVAEPVRRRHDREADRATGRRVPGMTWRSASSSFVRRAPQAWNRELRKRPAPWPARDSRSTRSSGIGSSRIRRRRPATASGFTASDSVRRRANRRSPSCCRGGGPTSSSVSCCRGGGPTSS